MKVLTAVSLLPLLLSIGCDSNAQANPQAGTTAPPPSAAPAVEPKAAAAEPDPADERLLAGADVENGKKVYTQHCLACHQADGKSMNGMLGANFVDDKSVLNKPNSELLHSIAEGKQGKAAAMPPWKDTLPEQSRKDALAYIRATFAASK